MIAIDDSKGPPVEQIREHTQGRGADCGCDCVGYQAHDPQGHESSSMVVNDLVRAVKIAGGIGVVGLYLPQDPGAADDEGKQGRISFEMGEYWLKGQRMGTGQANVKHYNRALRDLIHDGKPSRPGSFRSSCRCQRPRAPTGISTLATRGGPRWFSSPGCRRCESISTPRTACSIRRSNSGRRRCGAGRA